MCANSQQGLPELFTLLSEKQSHITLVLQEGKSHPTCY